MDTQTNVRTPLTKEMRSAVSDLYVVNPWVGLGRFLVLGALCLGAVAAAWFATGAIAFLGWTAVAALVYAFWLICTHDAVHHTLTGNPFWDEVLPRAIAWPILWPHGAYGQMHWLHHSWNGTDLRDPERVQWTAAEYARANPLVKWYVRHQWPIDIFGFGSVGLVCKAFSRAFRLQSQYPKLRDCLILDILGILFVQGSLTGAAIATGHGWRYLLFWVVVSWVVGAILQTRDHLEHYGTWGDRGNNLFTQLYGARNLAGNGFVSWLVGGLDRHGVHHAFPGIPFDRLPKAYERIQAILVDCHQQPLLRERSYLQETMHLGRQWSLISGSGSEKNTSKDSYIPYNRKAA